MNTLYPGFNRKENHSYVVQLNMFCRQTKNEKIALLSQLLCFKARG